MVFHNLKTNRPRLRRGLFIRARITFRRERYSLFKNLRSKANPEIVIIELFPNKKVYIEVKLNLALYLVG